MLRRLDIFGQLFRFRFDVLVVQEDTNQRAGLIGMGQRDKAFIFQHQGFFTTKTRGWGLGLSLSRRIIEEYHNGKIAVVESEPGKGTMIRITLKRFFDA